MTTLNPGKTAPKGQSILVWGKPKNTKLVRFTKPGWHVAAYDSIDQAFCVSGGTWEGPFIKPKYWLPLPASPTV